MRWSARREPHEDAPAAPEARPRATRADCADWVVLARRMSIPDDHAFRQCVDLAMGLNAEDDVAARR